MSLFDKMTKSIITSADRGLTMADLMLEMTRHLKEDDPERIFWEWFITNQKRRDEAFKELGIEPISEGPDLVDRMRQVVMPILVEKYNERKAQG